MARARPGCPGEDLCVSLTILSVGYPLAPVGPDAVGGAEQVLHHLDEGLVARGHRSIVIAPEGSRVRGSLIPVPLSDVGFGKELRQQVHDHYRRLIDETLRRCSIDLIHMHGLDFDAYLPSSGPPVLVTLHLPAAFYSEAALRPARPRTYLQPVSLSQQRDLESRALLLPWIGNGVPVKRLADVGPLHRRSFAFALGRICPEKGFHLALDAARQEDFPLFLAGRVYPYESHEGYFVQQIVPRLSRRRRFIGAVDFERKRRFLSAARCVLVPSLVPESCSLVSLESLACGTPVIAFPAGALRDVIEDGVTGFLVENEREMADAIRRVDSIRPEACREAARRRFSLERMVEEYLHRYELLCASPSTN